LFFIANVGKMPVTLVNLTVFLFLCRLFINRKLQDEKAYLSAFVAAGCGCDCLWRESKIEKAVSIGNAG